MTEQEVPQVDILHLEQLLAEILDAGPTWSDGRLSADKLAPHQAVSDDPVTVYRRILAIADRAAQEPSVDKRTPEEIIGYDETGLPS